MAWQQETGVKAINNLETKGLLNNASDWCKKDLTDQTPLWLFFEMINRITEENGIVNPITYVIVTAESLNVRDDIMGNILGVVHKNDKLQVIGEKSGWYHVKSEDIDGWVHGDYVKKSNAAEANGQYRSIRCFDSKVHIFEASQDDFIIDVTLGQRDKYEKLSDIKPDSKLEAHADNKIACAINGGFFGGGEHLWGYVDEGKYYYATNADFPDFIYYKDGTTEIKNLKTQSEIAQLQLKTNWIIGISWALVINGEINTLNKEAISHSATRQPRTLLGQKEDGTWILVVVEGRGKNNSRGMTADQCAELMHNLGTYNAINLDGGGSSEMIVDGSIMNEPTDGSERKIGSAILVLNKDK